MTYSANEVMTLAARAARGAGAAPDQAALFGRAALCHLIAGREPALLAAALAALPGGPIPTFPALFERLQESALGGDTRGRIPKHGPAALLTSFAEAQPFLTTLQEQQGAFFVTTDLQTPTTRHCPARTLLPAELAQQMQTLAARLLVPESDASRRSGAGAGLTDND